MDRVNRAFRNGSSAKSGLPDSLSPRYIENSGNLTRDGDHKTARLSKIPILNILTRHYSEKPESLPFSGPTPKTNLMNRLVIKFPSRNRPEKFKDVFNRYCTMLGGRNHVRFVVTLDHDDPTMNNESMWQWFETRKRNIDLKLTYGHSKTKIEACNADMEGESGDVLLLASDDMVPIAMGYDDIIMESFRQSFPDFDGAIKFWDGLRPKDDPLMTLTVMGFPLYRRFGYIYHPDYVSQFCDDEQTAVCMILGKLRRCDHCIIHHQWTPEPFDSLHARNQAAPTFQRDQQTFHARLQKQFDLGDLINVSASK